jgi:hypothetical protein
MAIRLAVDLKLFDAISNCHGAFNIEQLQIEADPLLVSKWASILDPCACVDNCSAIPGCHVCDP